MCVSIQYFYFCFWLTSLCIIGSSFVHLVRTDSDTFLFVAELYSIVYMYHASVSIHLLISFWSLLMPVGCEMRNGMACLPSLFMVGWGVRWGRWKCNAKGQARVFWNVEQPHFTDLCVVMALLPLSHIDHLSLFLKMYLVVLGLSCAQDL